MRPRRCVAETVKPDRIDPSTWSKVWHIVPTGFEHDGSDWCPIICDDREGIVLPGPIHTIEPTCPDCLAAS